ncbi:MAG: hypothetical protein KGP28_09535 [Bdellovibrionales bacterium]|nr:hypothetical protein [Bdellovibrionales bacterium]
MKPFIVPFIAGFFFASSASAYLPTPESACSSVDLRSDFILKMRNQRGISWCYAHAAADYLQYTFRLPEPISAADIAINYAGSNLSKIVTFFKKLSSKEARAEPSQTGFIIRAVKGALDSGYCPEWALPSEEWTKVHQNGKREKVELIRAILEIYSLQRDVHSGKYPFPESLPFSYEFEHIDRSGFHSILKQTSRNTILSGIRKNACSAERKPYPLSPIKTCFKLKGKKIYQRINQQLSSGMPISVDFFSGILGNLNGAKRKIDDLHTVLIYGRKYDSEKNECVYLMKNSYGEDCTQYDPKIKCEAGYLWFPESKLHPYLTSTLSITRQ